MRPSSIFTEMFLLPFIEEWFIFDALEYVEHDDQCFQS